MKKYIKLGLLVIWLGVIYYFSSQDSVTSSNLSNGLLSSIGTFFSVEDLVNFIDKYQVLIRKLAHFSEFFILGILMYISLKEYTSQEVFSVALILCIIYAAVDETHQLFVSGRAFMVTDILIDSFGALIGCLLSCLINKYVTKRKSA